MASGDSGVAGAPTQPQTMDFVGLMGELGGLPFLTGLLNRLTTVLDFGIQKRVDIRQGLEYLLDGAEVHRMVEGFADGIPSDGVTAVDPSLLHIRWGPIDEPRMSAVLDASGATPTSSRRSSTSSSVSKGGSDLKATVAGDASTGDTPTPAPTPSAQKGDAMPSGTPANLSPNVASEVLIPSPPDNQFRIRLVAGAAASESNHIGGLAGVDDFFSASWFKSFLERLFASTFTHTDADLISAAEAQFPLSWAVWGRVFVLDKITMYEPNRTPEGLVSFALRLPINMRVLREHYPHIADLFDFLAHIGVSIGSSGGDPRKVIARMSYDASSKSMTVRALLRPSDGRLVWSTAADPLKPFIDDAPGAASREPIPFSFDLSEEPALSVVIDTSAKLLLNLASVRLPRMDFELSSPRNGRAVFRLKGVDSAWIFFRKLFGFERIIQCMINHFAVHIGLGSRPALAAPAAVEKTHATKGAVDSNVDGVPPTAGDSGVAVGAAPPGDIRHWFNMTFHGVLPRTLAVRVIARMWRYFVHSEAYMDILFLARDLCTGFVADLIKYQ
eukprot:Opistho-2@3430